MEANRNFANKVWNAGSTHHRRAAPGAGPAFPVIPSGPGLTAGSGPGCAPWPKRDVDRLFQLPIRRGRAAEFTSFWSEFADWYVEIAKQQLAEGGDRFFIPPKPWPDVRYLPASPASICHIGHRDGLGHLELGAAERHSPALRPEGGWEDALIVARWPKPQPEEPWEAPAVADFELVMEGRPRDPQPADGGPGSSGKRIPALIAGGDRTEVIREQIRPLGCARFPRCR